MRILLATIFVIAATSVSAADTPEVIVYLEGPVGDEAMGYYICMLPDYDNDGYPEVLVSSLPDDVDGCDTCNFVRVFDGGDPPSLTPQKLIDSAGMQESRL